MSMAVPEWLTRRSSPSVGCCSSAPAITSMAAAVAFMRTIYPSENDGGAPANHVPVGSDPAHRSNHGRGSVRRLPKGSIIDGRETAPPSLMVYEDTRPVQ